jgi:hypothetical protein
MINLLRREYLGQKQAEQRNLDHITEFRCYKFRTPLDTTVWSTEVIRTVLGQLGHRMVGRRTGLEVVQPSNNVRSATWAKLLTVPSWPRD